MCCVSTVSTRLLQVKASVFRGVLLAYLEDKLCAPQDVLAILRSDDQWRMLLSKLDREGGDTISVVGVRQVEATWHSTRSVPKSPKPNT